MTLMRFDGDHFTLVADCPDADSSFLIASRNPLSVGGKRNRTDWSFDFVRLVICEQFDDRLRVFGVPERQLGPAQ